MGNRCCKRADAPPADTTDPNEGSNPFKPNNRKCTDLLCSLVFVLFWIGMIIIAAVGYAHGEPKRLVYGTDWMGRTCGLQADTKDGVPAYDLTEYPYLMYPRLSEDIIALFGEDSKDVSSLMTTSTLRKFYGVCVRKCPMTNDSSSTLYIHAYKDYSANKEPVNTLTSSAGASVEDGHAGSPWKLMMDTTEVLQRCVELSKIEVMQVARCVDDCSAEEEAYFAANNISEGTCGESRVFNPMRDCGEEDCKDMVLRLRPNCTSVEVAREETQISNARSDPITDMLSRQWFMVARWIGDIQKAALPILVCGGLFALVLGFVWLIMLRYCAGVFVWFVIFMVIVMQLVITLFCAYEGNLITASKINNAMESMGVSSTTVTSTINNSMNRATNYINGSGWSVAQDQVHYWAIACYVMIGVDVALFLVLIFMCSRIRIAIGIIREASKALQSMPSLVLYPIIPTVFAMGLVAYWVVAAAYIMTSANISVKDVQVVLGRDTPIAAEVENDDVVNYLLIYHLFGLLWTNQFIQAVAYTTLAGCFCEYYWTLDKRQVKGFVIGRSMYRTLRYHLGSMAFGSLIIAVVQMVRLALEYVDQKTKQAQQGNKAVKVAMLCLKCCLWCFEAVVKFLNANAFIIVAMKGSSFCPAMKDSFLLLFNNAARVATVSIITRFLMVLGKLFIAAFCMFFMFLFIRHPPEHVPTFFLGDLDSVSSPIFPMLITGLLGYATASFFLDVYGTGIDTILLCFCEDCNVNKGTDKYYMSDELFAYIDGPAKKNAFKAYQPARDVSARDRPGANEPITAPPIYQKATPMTKK